MAAARRVALRAASTRLLKYASPPTLTLRVATRGLATAHSPASLLSALDTFADRHIGLDENEITHMLSQLGYDSMDAFIADTVPPKIRVPPSAVSNDSIPSFSESELHQRARALAKANKSMKSYIGMGYHNAVVPPVILRNVSCGAIFYRFYF